jgi:hypothetical protein
MAFSYRTILDERQFRASTGISPSKFKDLVALFSISYETIYQVSITQQQLNMNQSFVFPTYEDLLFFTLFALKNPMTEEVLGAVFCISDTGARNNFAKGLRILQHTLTHNNLLPVRSFETVEDFISYFSQEGTLIIDATELRVQRPADQDEQKVYYSGKKKAHTVKTLIVIGESKKINFLSNLVAGKIHDYQLFKDNFGKDKAWFEEKIVRVDLGFLGLAKDYKVGQLYIPHKKKRVKKGVANELTPVQKEENKKQAQARVVVEHWIGKLKNFRILHQTIRIKSINTLDYIVGIVAGIVNFINA